MNLENIPPIGCSTPKIDARLRTAAKLGVSVQSPVTPTPIMISPTELQNVALMHSKLAKPKLGMPMIPGHPPSMHARPCFRPEGSAVYVAPTPRSGSSSGSGSDSGLTLSLTLTLHLDFTFVAVSFLFIYMYLQ